MSKRKRLRDALDRERQELMAENRRLRNEYRMLVGIGYRRPAAGALLIEDGFDAARDRAAQWLIEYDGFHWDEINAFVKGNALLMAADLLRAVVGEGETDGR